MALWPFTQRKAAPERTIAEVPKQPNLIYLDGGISAMLIPWNDSIAVEEALRHPVAGRAINKIATAVSQARWFAEVDPYAPKKEQAGKEKQIEAIQSLLDSPNNEMTPAMLRYWMTQNYVCYGRVPVKIGFSAVNPNTPTGIYPLEVLQVHARRNATGSVDSYDYGTGENKQRFNGRAKWKPGDKDGFVDQIWKPSLKGFQNVEDVNTPLQSIGLPLQVVRSLLQRAISAAKGHPNCKYLVTASKNLTVDQLAALKKHLNADHATDGQNSGGVPVLQNAGEVVIHKLDNDLSDIHSKVPMDDMARMIFGAFDIPIALIGLGAADAAKFAGNYDSSRATFWEDTVLPGYLNPLFQGLTRMLCPPGVRISPDLDSIPALMPSRIASMSALNGVTFLTVDEKRELYGWEATTEIEQTPKQTTPPKDLTK